MTTSPEQLPLDLKHREAFAREDFFVSQSNAEAVGWIDRWKDGWQAPLLVIYGPKGCGKTHLCRVFEKQTDGGAVIVDDADLVVSDRVKAEEIFHRYNRAREEGCVILMTAQAPPRDWPFALPDLKSRVLASPVVAVLPPDDALMGVVLAKLFSDRQIFVPQEVVQFILSRVERSFETLQRLAAEIDKRALAEKRAVTVPLVREVMQGKLL